MTRKLLSLSVVALFVAAVGLPAVTADAGDDGLVPRERMDFGRSAPELDRTTTWDRGSSSFLQEIWERILQLIPRLPGPEDKNELPKPEGAPTIDPLGWKPNSG